MQDTFTLINDIPGLVIFSILNLEFCMDVKDVKKISDLNGWAGFSEIIFNDQNYIVVDLQSLFFNAEPPSEKHRKAILSKIFGKNIAFLVDEVKEFITLDALFIKKTIEMTEYPMDFYKWKLNIQSRTIYYPDYGNISRNIELVKIKNETGSKIILS